MLISENLALDVACLVQVALYEALTATEGGNGLASSGLVEVSDLFHLVCDLHAAATATESSLNGDWQTVLLSERDDLVCILNRFLGAWSHRSVSLQRNVASGDLVAQGADGLWRRADPDQASVLNSLSKVAVLRQEAVARVDGISAGLLCGIQNLIED